jgi:hypothetical protein
MTRIRLQAKMTRLASGWESWVPARDDEAIWFVVSRAARLHAGPSVSSPIVHFYPVGTELKFIGYEQGWFHVLEPTTSRRRCSDA